MQIAADSYGRRHNNLETAGGGGGGYYDNAFGSWMKTMCTGSFRKYGGSRGLSTSPARGPRQSRGSTLMSSAVPSVSAGGGPGTGAGSSVRFGRNTLASLASQMSSLHSGSATSYGDKWQQQYTANFYHSEPSSVSALAQAPILSPYNINLVHQLLSMKPRDAHAAAAVTAASGLSAMLRRCCRRYLQMPKRYRRSKQGP